MGRARRTRVCASVHALHLRPRSRAPRSPLQVDGNKSDLALSATLDEIVVKHAPSDPSAWTWLGALGHAHALCCVRVVYAYSISPSFLSPVRRAVHGPAHVCALRQRDARQAGGVLGHAARDVHVRGGRGRGGRGRRGAGRRCCDAALSLCLRARTLACAAAAPHPPHLLSFFLPSLSLLSATPRTRSPVLAPRVR